MCSYNIISPSLLHLPPSLPSPFLPSFLDLLFSFLFKENFTFLITKSNNYFSLFLPSTEP